MSNTADHMLLEAAKRGDFALIETLILRPDGAGRTARLEYHDVRNGWTALHYAASNGHMSCVSKLLQLGSNPTVGTGRKCDNITPLHLAASAGFGEIVTLLVHYGADVSKTDFNGSTARDHAGFAAEAMDGVEALLRRDCELILRVQETTEEWAATKVDPPRYIRSNVNDMNPELSRIVQMSVGGSERLMSDSALFLSLRGTVLTWGNNSDSQLGSMGDTKKRLGGSGAGHYDCLKIVPSLNRQNIRCEQVSIGVRHSIILLSNGWAATSGEGFNGQLGLGEDMMRCTQFTPVYFPPPQVRVKCVAAGLYHSILITVDGRMYSCGSNRKGQCGQGDRHDRMLPTEMLLPKLQQHDNYTWDPQYVVCGELHSVVVVKKMYKDKKSVLFPDDGVSNSSCNSSSKNEGKAKTTTFAAPEFVAMSCGSAVSTGHSGTQDSLVLRVIRDLDAAIVSCGAKHTISITSHGNVYSWGSGAFGQLGHGDRASQTRPKILGIFVEGKAARKTKIIAAAAGSRHTILLSSKGKLFAFGNNSFGQLGRGDRRDSLLTKEIHICMPGSQAEHYWEKRNCGVDGDVPHPVLIAAGGCCTFVCMQNGLVMHFGSNSRDKLKRQEFPDHLEATPLELPDDDDDTPSEKRRKLRLKIRNVEKMLKK
jgi:alpha-tubulin suppressor-like RCC1 family protein